MPQVALFLEGGTLGFKYLMYYSNTDLDPRMLSQAIRSAQKCCQNAGNADSETQISKTFEGGIPPDALD